jgi:hypothetical protein
VRGASYDGLLATLCGDDGCEGDAPWVVTVAGEPRVVGLGDPGVVLSAPLTCGPLATVEQRRSAEGLRVHITESCDGRLHYVDEQFLPDATLHLRVERDALADGSDPLPVPADPNDLPAACAPGEFPRQ